MQKASHFCEAFADWTGLNNLYALCFDLTAFHARQVFQHSHSYARLHSHALPYIANRHLYAGSAQIREFTPNH